MIPKSLVKQLEDLVAAAEERKKRYTLLADLKSKGKQYGQYLNDRSVESDSRTA